MARASRAGSGDGFLGRRLRDLIQAMNELTPLLKRVGTYLAARAVAAFREQRRGRVAWRERGCPNVAGILADLVGGGAPKKRRFETRPALVDTGALRRSIAWRIVGRTAVEVGTQLRYAGVLQTGGVTRSPVPASIVKPLSKFLRRRGRETPCGGSSLREQLGFLFHLARTGRPLETRVPARPFVTIEQEDRVTIRDMAQRYLTVG